MSQPKEPKRPLALNSESDDSSPSTKRQRRATRKGARVLPSNGRDFKRRTKEEKAIWTSSSSEDEAPESAQPIPIPSPHISDCDTDESSLHSLKPLPKRSGAENLAKEYNPGNPDFSESDDESEQGKTTETSPRSGENNHDHYPVRYLAARQKELEDELDKTKQGIEQSMEKELVVRGQLIGIIGAISKLRNPATISSLS
jgi:hypothetical protein